MQIFELRVAHPSMEACMHRACGCSTRDVQFWEGLQCVETEQIFQIHKSTSTLLVGEALRDRLQARGDGA